MKTYDASALAANAVSARPDRPAMTLVHDSPDVRVALFRIEPGQQVAVHTSPSSVLLHVVSGSGIVSGADGVEQRVSAGAIVTYEPGEPHGMRADSETFTLAATIAPRPAAR
ncbi:MAG: cupin domain-containing protein [Gemmatimonadaceae bacterium]|nr:cupin domain-containing protein [Gemmatimonadaceae bacterium]